MTQEEKQLLLKDLSARLPYRVKVKSSRRTVVTTLTLDIINDFYLGCDIKPYLRPMSSMTEKDIILLLESRIKEIIGDAQPNPVLRIELQGIIDKIK